MVDTPRKGSWAETVNIPTEDPSKFPIVPPNFPVILLQEERRRQFKLSHPGWQHMSPKALQKAQDDFGEKFNAEAIRVGVVAAIFPA